MWVPWNRGPFVLVVFLISNEMLIVAKLMVVGFPEVGKTSTIRSLLGEPFQSECKSTIGAGITTATSSQTSFREPWKKQTKPVNLMFEASTAYVLYRIRMQDPKTSGN